ncbi:TIGR02678 family protein [Antrihabitans cavernicola]|uniref:TIGR02678 family protein n=1 Tax=Antrihabitans cavernicola TaxID=2495913 RepID=A0A5A7SHG1_9NOCA|nr:TIGR02678 family protein [Spelaeibacter cavernicola]KAA0023631.1 TIGR02678 family protein [Spelaeibacter cavernicola]
MRAKEIAPLTLDNYQRAARVILSNHLVTTTFPDRIALPLLRRWATELRDDMQELFGYRLEVTETTARLFPVFDRLDATQPARTATDRVFDRRRYAYLALALAALGRAGDQITLSELADHVAAETAQVPGLELATERAADRDAFVDAVGWLATRGAIALADGDAGGWVSDPEAGEALYDIDRSVVTAIFRPQHALQHLRSVRGLLAEPSQSAGENTRRIRRALIERPVVYYDDFEPDDARTLAADKTIGDVELLTGLTVERRAEGVALIDSSGRLSDVRFPSTGTVAQVALLLAGEIADRVLDLDDPIERRAADTGDGSDRLVAALDGAIPESGVFDALADEPGADIAIGAATEHPFMTDRWLTDTVAGLVDRYGKTFAAQWQADRDGLRDAAVEMLQRLRLVQGADGGLLALPALARYRGVVVNVRSRPPDPSLFADSCARSDSEVL